MFKWDAFMCGETFVKLDIWHNGGVCIERDVSESVGVRECARVCV
jgi:hypothetical protein